TRCHAHVAGCQARVFHTAHGLGVCFQDLGHPVKGIERASVTFMLLLLSSSSSVVMHQRKSGNRLNIEFKFDLSHVTPMEVVRRDQSLPHHQLSSTLRCCDGFILRTVGRSRQTQSVDSHLCARGSRSHLFHLHPCCNLCGQ